MAIGIALLLLVGAIIISYCLSNGWSRKRKMIVWGIGIMLAIAPLLSWLIGISFGVFVGDGFAGGALMVLLFLIIFPIGLIMLLIGIFRKDKTESI